MLNSCVFNCSGIHWLTNTVTLRNSISQLIVVRIWVVKEQWEWPVVQASHLHRSVSAGKLTPAIRLQRDFKLLGPRFCWWKTVGRMAWGVMTDYEEIWICKEMPLLCNMGPGTILVLVLLKYKNSFCLVQEQCWPPQNICRGTKHRQDPLSTICCSSASTNAWHVENTFSSFSKSPLH